MLRAHYTKGDKVVLAIDIGGNKKGDIVEVYAYYPQLDILRIKIKHPPREESTIRTIWVSEVEEQKTG